MITRAVLDIDTMAWEHVERVPYYGPWAKCKGDHSAQEQQNADAQRAQENALMQQQLQMQQQQISGVNAALDPIIAAGGMSPQQQAALTNVAYGQLAQDFKNTNANLNNQLVSRGMTGGQMAGSGGVAQGFGQLNAMEDYLKSQNLSQIQLQKQQQLMQALGAKMGVAGLYGQNVGGFNQGALSALGTGQQAAQAADQASTGFWGSMFGALASPFSISKSF